MADEIFRFIFSSCLPHPEDYDRDNFDDDLDTAPAPDKLYHDDVKVLRKISNITILSTDAGDLDSSDGDDEADRETEGGDINENYGGDITEIFGGDVNESYDSSYNNNNDTYYNSFSETFYFSYNDGEHHTWEDLELDSREIREGHHPVYCSVNTHSYHGSEGTHSYHESEGVMESDSLDLYDHDDMSLTFPESPRSPLLFSSSPIALSFPNSLYNPSSTTFFDHYLNLNIEDSFSTSIDTGGFSMKLGKGYYTDIMIDRVKEFKMRKDYLGCSGCEDFNELVIAAESEEIILN